MSIVVHDVALDARGRAHGRGCASYDDGMRYKGEFKHGARHGQGVASFADDAVRLDVDDVNARERRIEMSCAWIDDVPDGACAIAYDDGRVFRGTFARGTLLRRGCVTREDGVTVAYDGEFDDDGAFDGEGVLVNAHGGRLRGRFRHGALMGGCVATWREGGGGTGARARVVIGIARRRSGRRIARERNGGGGAIDVARAFVVKSSSGDLGEVEEAARAMNEGDETGGRTRAVEKLSLARERNGAGEALNDVLARGGDVFERERVEIRDCGVYATRDIESGGLVAYYIGERVAIRGGALSEEDAERLSATTVMIRNDDEWDDDMMSIVAAHDERTPFAVARGIRVIKLSASRELCEGRAANVVRVDAKHETNCERAYVEDHALFGETMCLRAKKRILKGEECTVSPDYHAGWCLDPHSEAGYYESMRCHPPAIVYNKDNDVRELGRVVVKSHARWRALYLDRVEQGLSYVNARGDVLPNVLGFQYIRTMARATQGCVESRRWKQATVVAVGLGTGALPLYVKRCLKTRTRMDVVVVERSQSVINACQQINVPMRIVRGDDEANDSALVDDTRCLMDVVRADIVEYLDHPSRRRTSHITLLDAYDGQGRIPDHVRDENFLSLLAKSMTKDGFVICNCWDGAPGSTAAIELDAFKTSLHRHIGLVRVERVLQQEHNVVLVAQFA